MDFKRLLSTKLKYLTACGKLVKVLCVYIFGLLNSMYDFLCNQFASWLLVEHGHIHHQLQLARFIDLGSLFYRLSVSIEFRTPLRYLPTGKKVWGRLQEDRGLLLCLHLKQTETK